MQPIKFDKRFIIVLGLLVSLIFNPGAKANPWDEDMNRTYVFPRENHHVLRRNNNSTEGSQGKTNCRKRFFRFGMKTPFVITLGVSLLLLGKVKYDEKKEQERRVEILEVFHDEQDTLIKYLNGVVASKRDSIIEEVIKIYHADTEGRDPGDAINSLLPLASPKAQKRILQDALDKFPESLVDIDWDRFVHPKRGDFFNSKVSGIKVEMKYRTREMSLKLIQKASQATGDNLAHYLNALSQIHISYWDHRVYQHLSDLREKIWAQSRTEAGANIWEHVYLFAAATDPNPEIAIARTLVHWQDLRKESDGKNRYKPRPYEDYLDNLNWLRCFRAINELDLPPVDPQKLYNAIDNLYTNFPSELKPDLTRQKKELLYVKSQYLDRLDSLQKWD